MFDKTEEDTQAPDADVLRELPDEKLTEIAGCAKGIVGYCDECGELTAFVGRPTYNDSSACHNCGNRVGV